MPATGPDINEMPEFDVANYIGKVMNSRTTRLPAYQKDNLQAALGALSFTTFAKRMDRFMTKLRIFIKDDKQDNRPSDHHELCTTMANIFGLWETDPDSQQELFPVWLSRVVEGEMRDLNPDIDRG